MGEKRKTYGNLIIIGDLQSGKTSFVNKVAMNRFNESYRPTIGADFLTKTYQIQQKTITLHIWDTSGQERNSGLGHAFYRGSDAYIILFDITNRSSFERVREWKDHFINNYGSDDIFGVMVGNKIDNYNKRVITYEEGKAYADNEKMCYLEISAKTGQGCENLGIIIAHKIAEIYLN